MTKLPTDTLPRKSLLRLLATLAVVLVPHLPRLPLWASALVVGTIVWRTLSVLRQWPLLPAFLRVALTLGSFVGIFETFGRVTGQTAGVALITVMSALKLTELRTRRDTMVMVFLMYFMLITHFLFSQELWTAAYLLTCATLITGVLVDANHPGGALPLRRSLSFGLRFVAQALPLMIVIFILFPRIPGPLWGLPSDSGAARSGLSDSMSPGDISNLIQSGDEIAFRVRFDGPPPPMRERYWRGPVFARFDGRKWDSGTRPAEAAHPLAELSGPSTGYEVVLEPNRTPWLFALELPDRVGLPPDSDINADYQLVLSKGEVRERKLYRLQSHTHYRLQSTLPASLQALYTRLPKNSNPRAQALGRQWREQGLDNAAIVDAALSRFRNEPYYYTLQPPALGRNSVDEFLFDTRRGFCEHYAGSFTVLMRAAGIPARIVTGYQGGDKSLYGDDYVVHQSDAHAWSEVWLEGRGWIRVDPTAAVSPARIERGLGDALAGSELLPGFLDPAQRHGFRFNFAARWDWVNAQWNYWVLGYGPDLQQSFLRHFGLLDWSDMILALTVIVSLMLGVTGFLLLRRSGPTRNEDAALRSWQRMQRRLARQGLSIQAGEGPRDYAARVTALRPELAEPIRIALAHYLEARYLGEADATRQRALDRAIAAIRIARFRAARR